MTDPILLHGGGIDSTAVFLTLTHADKDFRVLHINYGQISHAAERKAIKKQCSKYGVPFEEMELPAPKKGKDLFKGRNALLLSAAFTRTNDVYTGLCWECVFDDSSEAFVDAFQDMVSAFNPQGKLHVPLFHLTKAQEYGIIQILDPDIPFWTCYERGPKPCGRCSHCVDLRLIRRGVQIRIPRIKYPKKIVEQRIEKDENV